VGKLVAGLYTLRSLDLLGGVAMLLIVESGESSFFLPLDFNFDEGGEKLLEDLNENLAVD